MALTNAQYDEIMRGYEQRQTENRHRLELRTKEIYEKEPRLTLLDDEFRVLDCCYPVMKQNPKNYGNVLPFCKRKNPV